jgi:hypothetical protein
MRGNTHALVGSDDVLADNGALHDEVLSIFAEIFAGKFRVPIPPIA